MTVNIKDKQPSHPWCYNMDSSKSFGLTPQPSSKKIQIKKGDPVKHDDNSKCKSEVISDRCKGEKWITKLMSLTVRHLLTFRIMRATSCTKIHFCLQYLVRLHVYNLLIIIFLLLSCSSWLRAHSQFHYQFWAFTLSFHFSLISYAFNLLVGWINGHENSGKIYGLHLLVLECLTIPSKPSSHWCWWRIMPWHHHDCGIQTQGRSSKCNGGIVLKIQGLPSVISL